MQIAEGNDVLQVFEDTKHLVQSAVDGYNVCIFAYGQTGSGKTFTIYGNEAGEGLTPRGCHELFRVRLGMMLLSHHAQAQASINAAEPLCNPAAAKSAAQCSSHIGGG